MTHKNIREVLHWLIKICQGDREGFGGPQKKCRRKIYSAVRNNISQYKTMFANTKIYFPRTNIYCPLQKCVLLQVKIYMFLLLWPAVSIGDWGWSEFVLASITYPIFYLNIYLYWEILSCTEKHNFGLRYIFLVWEIQFVMGNKFLYWELYFCTEKHIFVLGNIFSLTLVIVGTEVG